MELIWIVLIVLMAAFVKGITGFGFAMISLPLLLFFYSPKEIIPVLVVCNLVASVMIVLQKKDHPLINKKLKSLVIYGGVFTILGVFSLKSIAPDFLINGIAIFFVIISIIYIFNLKFSRKFRKYTYKIAGAVCGFLTGSISVGGPPLALFLNISKIGNRQFREVFSWFNIVSTSVAVIGYIIMDFFTTDNLKLCLLFSPALLIGAIFGKRINKFLPVAVFKKATIILTMLTSIMLLIFSGK